LTSLRIGCVKYLNARPLVHGWPGPIQLDHPSALCEQLSRDELDVALVSSFEYLRSPIYQIVDHVSISSSGPVYSVAVAHRGDISQVKQIELDPASQTAVNLLRCLLAELGLSPRLIPGRTCFLRAGFGIVPDARHRQCATPSGPNARLLIGDQAIRFRREHPNEFRFWDLGEQWKNLFNLPFVYALWLIRPGVKNAKQLAGRLRSLRDKNLAALDHLIGDIVAGPGLSAAASVNTDDSGQRNAGHHEFLARYYRQNLRFDFGQKEKQGLRTFAKLCVKNGLLPQRDLPFHLV
jgi:chorismate dehydratase